MSFNNFDDFLHLFKKVKPIGNGEHQALCPAHNDRNPSLHIKLNGDKVLLNCKAGCTTTEVVKSLNLTMADLFIKEDKPALIQRRLVKTYDYQDTDGKLLYQVCRFEPKGFSQRRLDGTGEWVNNLNGITPVLYHLPEINTARIHGETIYIAEGEKDADRLWDCGLVATCNPMGAGKWRPQYTETLTDAKAVVILPDKDDAGRKHAKDILQALTGKVKSIKVVEVTGDTNKDVSDYLNNGEQLDDFLKLVERTPEHRIITRITKQGGNELMRQHFAPIKWIVPNMLPEGATIISGTPKTGKSRLILNVALAVATGGKALSKMDVKQGSVLYLSLEDNARRLHEHLVELFGDNPPDLSKIDFWFESKLINEGGREDIEAWLQSHPDARLVVIDTLKKIRPKETSGTLYAQDYEAVSPATMIADKYHVAVVIIHHNNKRPTADDLMELISGTTGLTGGVDTTIIVRRKRGENDGTMHIYGRDIEDTEIALTFEGGWWAWLGDAKQVRMGEERKEIVDLLRATPDLKPNDIAKALGKNVHTTRNILTKMVNDSQLSYCEGVYNAIVEGA